MPQQSNSTVSGLVKGLAAPIIILLEEKKLTLAGLYFFKLIAIIMGGAKKPRMQ